MDDSPLSQRPVTRDLFGEVPDAPTKRERLNAQMREYRKKNGDRMRAQAIERTRKRAELRAPAPEIPCPTCGTMFSPRDPRQLCCSKPCGIVRYEKTPERRAGSMALYWKHHDRIRAASKAKYQNDPETRDKAVQYMRQRRIEVPDLVRVANEKHRKATRYRVPWVPLVRAAKGRAKDLRLPFDLTDRWAESIWTGACALSGLPFDLDRKLYSPSIDKIVPALGYVTTNCRFVLFAINMFKHDGTDEDVFRIAEAIAAMRR